MHFQSKQWFIRQRHEGLESDIQSQEEKRFQADLYFAQGKFDQAVILYLELLLGTNWDARLEKSPVMPLGGPKREVMDSLVRAAVGASKLDLALEWASKSVSNHYIDDIRRM